MNYQRKTLLYGLFIIMSLVCLSGFISCKSNYQSVYFESTLDPISLSDTDEFDTNSLVSDSEEVNTRSSESISEGNEDSSSVVFDSTENPFSEDTSEENESPLDSDFSVSSDISSSEEEGTDVEIVIHRHNYIIISEQKPTCEKMGCITYACVCGAEKKENIEPLKHLIVTDEAVEGSCIFSGLTTGSHCSRCNKIFVEQKETGYGDHSMQECVCVYCGLLELKYEFVLDYDGIINKEPYYVCSTPIGVDTSNVHRIIIPDTYNNHPVAGIADRAFANFYALYSVEIGVNVIHVGTGAFACCYNLVEIYDKSIAQVSKDTSKNGSLTAHAKDIYNAPYVSKLTQRRDGFVTYTDGNDVWLIGYDGTAKNAVIPNGVTKIGLYVFAINDVTVSITVPKSVRYISAYAFIECGALSGIILEQADGWVTAKTEDAATWLPWADDMSDPATVYDAFTNHYKQYYWKQIS